MNFIKQFPKPMTGAFLKKHLKVSHSLNNVKEQLRASLHSSSVYSHQQQGDRPMPAVYYYQNPFRWLKVKWQVLRLTSWDSEFSQDEFKRGSIQAISLVTNIVRTQQLDNLKGLLSPHALSKLRLDIVALWSEEIVRNIALQVTDVKLAIPTKIQLHTGSGSRRVSDIDMWFMGMKWEHSDALLIMDFVARFNKDFTKSRESDWTISFFELRKYHVYNSQK